MELHLQKLSRFILNFKHNFDGASVHRRLHGFIRVTALMRLTHCIPRTMHAAVMSETANMHEPSGPVCRPYAGDFLMPRWTDTWSIHFDGHRVTRLTTISTINERDFVSLLVVFRPPNDCTFSTIYFYRKAADTDFCILFVVGLQLLFDFGDVSGGSRALSLNYLSTVEELEVSDELSWLDNSIYRHHHRRSAMVINSLGDGQLVDASRTCP